MGLLWMGKLEILAAEIGRGVEEALPGIHKTILKKLPLAVAAMMEAHTPYTLELSTLLPLTTERAEMREQGLRRLLSNRLIESARLLEPFARRMLEEAAAFGQTILLSMRSDRPERSFRGPDGQHALRFLWFSGQCDFGGGQGIQRPLGEYP